MFRSSRMKMLMTIPNQLSCLRLVLIPVYMVIYLKADTGTEHLLAALILSVSCITDALDGMIARKWHMESELGKILDPVADKLTQFTLTFCLSLRYPVLRTVLVLLVAKEILLILGSIHLCLREHRVPGAKTAGKVCTFVQFISFILLVALQEVPENLLLTVTYTNALLIVLAASSYSLSYVAGFLRDSRGKI